VDEYRGRGATPPRTRPTDAGVGCGFGVGWGFGGAPIGPFLLSAGGGCGVGAGLGWGAGFGFGAEYIDTSAAFDTATGGSGGGDKGGRVRNSLLNVVLPRARVQKKYGPEAGR